MHFKDILDKNRIVFNLESNNKEAIIEEIAMLFVKDNTINKNDLNTLLNDLNEREKLSSTGMQDGIAIPHAKSSVVNKISLAVAIDKKGKDFSSMDEEPSTLFFMIIAPEYTKKEHLDVLALISKLTFNEEALEEMLNTDSPEKVIEILSSL
ncbi:PTS sugar transporter subunit IIA [Oceanivirga salmonicida]|uniref:PTS sugar transporter subunit IIA n=1 Tax=Oceanivirga salmonicida TaxID=1769291 RepID=UPI0008379D83|nr:PTS sugar transporter subunit IIA [Oceanivirga salmonicida]